MAEKSKDKTSEEKKNREEAIKTLRGIGKELEKIFVNKDITKPLPIKSVQLKPFKS